jgi:hypothetical protein
MRIKYEFKGNTIFEIDDSFQELVDYIKQKEYIADLKDNWDDENSTGCNPETWVASVSFLANFARTLFNATFRVMDNPVITRGPNHSIDIDWSNSKKQFDMIFNVSNGGDVVYFYTKLKDEQPVEGEFNPKDYT